MRPGTPRDLHVTRAPRTEHGARARVRSDVLRKSAASGGAGRSERCCCRPPACRTGPPLASGRKTSHGGRLGAAFTRKRPVGHRSWRRSPAAASPHVPVPALDFGAVVRHLCPRTCPRGRAFYPLLTIYSRYVVKGLNIGRLYFPPKAGCCP